MVLWLLGMCPEFFGGISCGFFFFSCSAVLQVMGWLHSHELCTVFSIICSQSQRREDANLIHGHRASDRNRNLRADCRDETPQCQHTG